MLVPIALIIGVIVLAVCMLGIFWAVVSLIPFYAYIAFGAYQIWRANRKHFELENRVTREAELQRRFNEQETKAWLVLNEIEGRNGAERENPPHDLDCLRRPSPRK